MTSRLPPIAAAALALATGAAVPAASPRLESAALALEAARAAPTRAVQRATARYRAGAPVSCIDQTGLLAVRPIDRTAILWQDRASRFYLNLPPRGCEALRDDRTIATRERGRLCEGDFVRVLAAGGRDAGPCRLGRFTPYTR